MDYKKINLRKYNALNSGKKEKNTTIYYSSHELLFAIVSRDFQTK